MNQVAQLPVSQATGEIHVLTTPADLRTQAVVNCLTANGPIAAGTKVVSSACQGSSAQVWTAPGDGSLHMGNYCLDDFYGNGAGTQQQLWPCTKNPNQKWTYNTLGYLAIGVNGLCLGAEGNNPANGTKVGLEDCGYKKATPTNPSGQIWTLPT
ncbi:ricin-type beta-trefoil lectin domain protein [Streptomyces sp. NBC_00096]|uniref:ricin-type beta-trefoil lectin domain protein n=1 Tax=Streptomyces sp. NBC_00096 TaxID=2975650 RepID=UPI0032466CC5